MFAEFAIAGCFGRALGRKKGEFMANFFSPGGEGGALLMAKANNTFFLLHLASYSGEPRGSEDMRLKA